MSAKHLSRRFDSGTRLMYLLLFLIFPAITVFYLFRKSKIRFIVLIGIGLILVIGYFFFFGFR